MNRGSKSARFFQITMIAAYIYKYPINLPVSILNDRRQIKLTAADQLFNYVKTHFTTAPLAIAYILGAHTRTLGSPLDGNSLSIPGNPLSLSLDWISDGFSPRSEHRRENPPSASTVIAPSPPPLLARILKKVRREREIPFCPPVSLFSQTQGITAGVPEGSFFRAYKQLRVITLNINACAACF